MVTETVINHDVYLDSFTAEAVGGSGDYEYSISFMEAKDMMVYTVNELGLQPKSPTNNVSSGPASATKHIHRGRRRLWAIAKKHLGKAVDLQCEQPGNQPLPHSPRASIPS